MNKFNTLIVFVFAISSSVIAESLFDPSAMKNSHRLFITGELLVWRASQDNLAFVTESNNGGRRGNIKNLGFEWNPGYRVGLGWRTAHDQWDLYADFMHITSHARGHSNRAPLFPIWQVPRVSSVGGFAARADAHWKVLVDMADLELGRNCRVSKWLSIRPFIGVKGGVIQQKYRIDYRGGTAVPSGDNDAISLRSNYWGVGIRAGFDTLWGFGKGISLYADGAISALSGDFNILEREELKKAGLLRMRVTDRHSSMITVGELAMGLQWDRFFSQERYHLGVRAGWELQLYANQNQFFRFISSVNPAVFSRNNSDLSFMGVSLGFRFDF